MYAEAFGGNFFMSAIYTTDGRADTLLPGSATDICNRNYTLYYFYS